MADNNPTLERGFSRRRPIADHNLEQHHPAPERGSSRRGINVDSSEDRRKKRIKLAIYIVAFIVFQCIVIAVFSAVVMKVRTPKFMVGNGVVVRTLTTNIRAPSFKMTFFAPIRVKNENFGPYKYDATTVNFTYAGVQVGQISIPKSKVNFKSTKKINMNVTVNTANLPRTMTQLGTELSSNVLTLNSVARMSGKVELMLIFKKKKATNMNCTMTFTVPTKTVKAVSCI